MRILGIDPGLATMGWGVIETNGYRERLVQYGALITYPKDTYPTRLASLYSGVKGLIDIALLRNRAAKLNITEISDKTGEMRIFFSYFELDDIMKLIKLYNGKAKLQNNAKPYIIINKPKTQKTIDAFSEFINQYELIFNKNNGE